MTEVKVVKLRRADQDVVKLAIQAPLEGRLQEAEFDFDLNHDCPKQVRLARRVCVEMFQTWPTCGNVF